LPVPAGYTFVQPHWRGEGAARPTQYRRRSALACLHALQPQSVAKAGLRGLEFLEQVRDDLERHGHQVLSVTNYFEPNDCGVDIRTLRQGIQWTVRVKEKTPNAKMQEQEVKAFADALPSDRVWAGGMLVTNTGYTKAAEDLARKLGIHTLLGARSAFPP
jgi:HJR/Mrr/RecB family endonuclease